VRQAFKAHLGRLFVRSERSEDGVVCLEGGKDGVVVLRNKATCHRGKIGGGDAS
jgi:hypothetical protein